MRAVTFTAPGPASALTLTDLPILDPQPDQLLVKVRAAGVNRADIAQRQGNYPPPPGHSPILGLEIAGEVINCGANVTEYQMGDRVFGLVDGGGYAEYVVIDHKVAMPIPEHWSYVQAAAVAEVFLTVDVSVFQLGELKAGESLLLHAGGSGIGTAGIQMARYIGATVYITAGSDAKIARAIDLGATAGINYHKQDFEKEIKTLTQQTGVDVILDNIGGDYFPRNLNCLKVGGRLIQIAALRGNQNEISLGRIIMKRLQIKGNVMRGRSLQDKRVITQHFVEQWLPILSGGEITPIIDTVFHFKDVQAAHEYVEGNRNFGKVVLEW